MSKWLFWLVLGLSGIFVPGSRRVLKRVPGYPVFRVVRLKHTLPWPSSIVTRGKLVSATAPPPYTKFYTVENFLLSGKCTCWKEEFVVHWRIKLKIFILHFFNNNVQCWLVSLSAFWSAIALSRQMHCMRKFQIISLNMRIQSESLII